MILTSEDSHNIYDNNASKDTKDNHSILLRTTSPAPMYTSKVHPPEDDVFDHRSIMSDNTTQRNLVRGASTSQRSQNTMYKAPRSDSLVIEEEPRGHSKGEHSESSLVGNAAPMGKSSQYQDLEYADPYKDQQAPLVSEAPNPFANSRFGKFMAKGKYPIEQRIEDKKRGIGRQKSPFVGASIS
ncbi:hypothetical protein PQX77_003816 [Marasmius sp. AFHP31]|nr:hypothetical protein PQX77_003816 [Marasmius sp. AFHP31]